MMATDLHEGQGPRSLLGLRPPADLAEGPVTTRPQAAPEAPPAATATAKAALPERPNYPTVSSGWDSEDDENTSKTSDLSTALRAAVFVLLAVVALGFVLSR